MQLFLLHFGSFWVVICEDINQSHFSVNVENRNKSYTMKHISAVHYASAVLGCKHGQEMKHSVDKTNFLQYLTMSSFQKLNDNLTHIPVRDQNCLHINNCHSDELFANMRQQLIPYEARQGELAATLLTKL